MKNDHNHSYYCLKCPEAQCFPTQFTPFLAGYSPSWLYLVYQHLPETAEVYRECTQYCRPHLFPQPPSWFWAMPSRSASPWNCDNKSVMVNFPLHGGHGPPRFNSGEILATLGSKDLFTTWQLAIQVASSWHRYFWPGEPHGFRACKTKTYFGSRSRTVWP